jgi:hypothetical protein
LPPEGAFLTLFLSSGYLSLLIQLLLMTPSLATVEYQLSLID